MLPILLTVLPVTVPSSLLVAVAVATLNALLNVAVEPLLIAAVRDACAIASPELRLVLRSLWSRLSLWLRLSTRLSLWLRLSTRLSLRLLLSAWFRLSCVAWAFALASAPVPLWVVVVAVVGSTANALMLTPNVTAIAVARIVLFIKSP